MAEIVTARHALLHLKPQRAALLLVHISEGFRKRGAQ